MSPTKRRLNPFIAWRERNQLSARQAVIVLGCSRMAYQGWERGEKPAPKYIRLAMLAIEHGLDEEGKAK
jgi:transcriptional regulator with XRE-family HTH domain